MPSNSVSKSVSLINLLTRAVEIEPLFMLEATFTCSLKALLNNAKAKPLLSNAQAPAPLPPSHNWTPMMSRISPSPCQRRQRTRKRPTPSSKTNTCKSNDRLWPPQSHLQRLFGDRRIHAAQSQHCGAVFFWVITVSLLYSTASNSWETGMETCGYSSVARELSECGVTSC